MKLSSEMETELKNRLQELSVEQQDDPAFRDMPRSDWLALAALFAVSFLAVVLINL